MNKRGNFRKFGVKGNDETWRPMLLADGMRERESETERSAWTCGAPCFGFDLRRKESGFTTIRRENE